MSRCASTAPTSTEESWPRSWPRSRKADADTSFCEDREGGVPPPISPPLRRRRSSREPLGGRPGHRHRRAAARHRKYAAKQPGSICGALDSAPEGNGRVPTSGRRTRQQIRMVGSFDRPARWVKWKKGRPVTRPARPLDGSETDTGPGTIFLPPSAQYQTEPYGYPNQQDSAVHVTRTGDTFRTCLLADFPCSRPQRAFPNEHRSLEEPGLVLT